MKLYASLFLVMMASHHVIAYLNGAPLSVCDTMEPGHGYQPQNGQSPYVVMPLTNSVLQDTFVPLALASISGDFFKGYLIMAFDETGMDPIGTFSVVTDGRLISCFNKTNNGVTHSRNNDKSVTTLNWKPPQKFVGQVQFRATFVKNFNTYWTNISSETVEVVRSEMQSSGTTISDGFLWPFLSLLCFHIVYASVSI